MRGLPPRTRQSAIARGTLDVALPGVDVIQPRLPERQRAPLRIDLLDQLDVATGVEHVPEPARRPGVQPGLEDCLDCGALRRPQFGFASLLCPLHGGVVQPTAGTNLMVASGCMRPVIFPAWNRFDRTAITWPLEKQEPRKQSRMDIYYIRLLLASFTLSR